MAQRRKIERMNRYLFEKAESEFYKHNQAKGLSEATQKQYKTYITVFFNWLEKNKDLDDIDEKTIEDFIEYKTSHNNKMISIATTLRHLRTFFKFAMKRGYISDVPIIIPKYEQELKTPYTIEEINKLIVKPATSSWVELRSWAMINYFISTGQRLSTVLNIKLSDVDLDNANVHLDWNKDKIEKIMPLSSALVKVLKVYIQLSDLKEDEYLFPDCYGGQLNRRSAEGAIARYNQNRGVSKTSIHLFRHTFAKYYIINGGNATKLQKLMNHKTITQTMKYVRLYGEDIASDLDDFNPLDNLKKQSNTSGQLQRRRREI